MSKLESLDIRPVGEVRRQDETQVIRILPRFQDGLSGIDRAEELQVLYWMHLLSDEDRSVLTCHPRGDATKKRRGVFALRSPMRPNPIGSTVVELLEVRQNELFVKGLDAEDGSPVIDIKIVS